MIHIDYLAADLGADHLDQLSQHAGYGAWTPGRIRRSGGIIVIPGGSGNWGGGWSGGGSSGGGGWSGGGGDFGGGGASGGW